VCYSCLEGWLGPRARGLQMHCIQKRPGVQFQGIFDDEESIHEVLPVLDTVVNSKEVKEVLRGAHLEYTFEEVVLRPRPLALDSIGVPPACRMCLPAVQLSACSFSRPDIRFGRCGDMPSCRM